MSKGQRLTFLGIAAVIAVIAVVILGTGGSGDEPPATAQQTVPARTPTATPDEPARTAEPTPEAPPLLRPGKATELEFDRGETVRFRVRSPQTDHVHVHGYDVFEDLPAGETITMSFKAEITGIFEIELEDSHQPLGRLRVNP